MIKELIGLVTTFFVMLPFLLINRAIFKLNDQKKFVFLFITINFIQVAFLLLLAYGLFIVGQKCLIGMLIIFVIYLFLFLILVFTNIRKRKNNRNREIEEFDEIDEEERIDVFYDEELSKTQEIAKKQIANDNILEENQFTMKVEEPDFNKIEKEEVLRTLEDIFKEI